MAPGLEPLQSTLFDQFIAEATESKSGLVVAEVRTGYHAKQYIGSTSPRGLPAIVPSSLHGAPGVLGERQPGVRPERHLRGLTCAAACQCGGHGCTLFGQKKPGDKRAGGGI